MQIPKRKNEKNSDADFDPHITQAKADELRAELERLKKISRPRLAHEVQEHAKLGDFSENAAYQIAKGKLRGLNHRIMMLEEMLNQAIIIPAGQAGGKVGIGSQVTVAINGSQKTYQILGSQESNPSKSIISHLSPIGAALLGHWENDEVEVELNDRKIKYRIIKIS